MNFYELETGQVIPAALVPLKFPNTSFPPQVTIEHVEGLGLLPIEYDPQPTTAEGEVVEPGDVRVEDGNAIQGWNIVSSYPITSDKVDAERDRRISAGFDFDGVHYQARPADWEVYSGKALEAFIAITNGSQLGDLRWSDPDSDFAWIAADNSRAPMDAQTVIELAKAASAHRTRLTFAGSDIKSLDPIPDDYAADWRWS